MLIAIILFATKCTERFEPVIDKYTELLVIDGFISTEKNTGVVTISHTYPYNEEKKNNIDDAEVFLICNDGSSYEFYYSEFGYYKIKDTSLQIEVGKKYKIHIVLNNDKVCESTFSEVLPNVEIDSINYLYEDGDVYNKGGLKFFLNSKNPDNKANYFYWRYWETWEFRVPVETRPYSRVCYRHNISNNFHVESKKEFSDKSINNLHLLTIENPTKKFNRKYSLEVSQHIISQEDYIFYKNLKEMNEESGTLFDKTPYSLTGNMVYITDEDDPILGNFTVSSVSSKRIFLEQKDLPKGVEFEAEFENCYSSYLNYPSQLGTIRNLLNKQGWVIIEIIPTAEPEEFIYHMSNSSLCFDCTTTGTNVVPDFWE